MHKLIEKIWHLKNIAPIQPRVRMTSIYLSHLQGLPMNLYNFFIKKFPFNTCQFCDWHDSYRTWCLFQKFLNLYKYFNNIVYLSSILNNKLVLKVQSHAMYSHAPLRLIKWLPEPMEPALPEVKAWKPVAYSVTYKFALALKHTISLKHCICVFWE
jgi:hypothetical protein